MLPRLENTRGYETRIHAESDFAFIYQPFILEGPGATYLIEWSTPDRPARLAKWTRTLGDLHLFIWPYERVRRPLLHGILTCLTSARWVQNRGWYYIGLHSVVHAEMESRWPVLERNVSFLVAVDDSEWLTRRYHAGQEAAFGLSSQAEP